MQRMNTIFFMQLLQAQKLTLVIFKFSLRRESVLITKPNGRPNYTWMLVQHHNKVQVCVYA